MDSKGLKNVVLCVLILGLILEHVQQVEGKSCCRSTAARLCYNICRLKGPRFLCKTVCGCKIIEGNTCPPDYPRLSIPILNSSAAGNEADATVLYCNLGCSSFVCDSINDDAMVGGEETKIEVGERCSAECGRFCDGTVYNKAYPVDA